MDTRRPVTIAEEMGHKITIDILPVTNKRLGKFQARCLCGWKATYPRHDRKNSQRDGGAHQTKIVQENNPN